MTSVLVSTAAVRSIETGRARRLQVDLAQPRRRGVRRGLPARSRVRARTVVQTREQHASAPGQAQTSGRGIHRRRVDVHTHHREAVVVEHAAQPGARVGTVGHRGLARFERVPHDRDVAVRVRAESRGERPIGERRRGEPKREHPGQHERTSHGQKSSFHGPLPLDNPRNDRQILPPVAASFEARRARWIAG